MLIPNSPATGVAFMWIKDYLKMAGLFHFDISSSSLMLNYFVGHAGSTGCSSIAVDSTEKQEIYEEYVYYMVRIDFLLIKLFAY